MTKTNIKEIIMSMRTSDNENEKIVNNLLGQIDLLTNEKITSIVSQIGDSEESIKNYIQNYIQTKLEKQQEHHHAEHTPINEMFTYEIRRSRSTISLHMPFDLRKMISENGIPTTRDTVNLHLLDAIERIRKLQKQGDPKFIGKENIYMISPLLVGSSEMRFLNGLGFETQTYTRKQLQNDKFVSEHPEAELAIKVFGKQNAVGTAIIGLDVINSAEWQKKRKSQVKAFEEKGIKLDTEEKDISRN